MDLIRSALALASWLLAVGGEAVSAPPELLSEPGFTVVEVEVAMVGSGATPPASLRVVRESTGTSASEDLLEAPLTIPGKAKLRVPSGEVLRFELVAPGLWAAPHVHASQGASQALKLTAWRTGRLVGALKPPPGVPPPTELELRFESAPRVAKEARIEATTVSCPLAEGRLSCEVPASLLDLRLRPAGNFAPLYRWEVAVDAGGRRSLGSVDLLLGASVSGWVETADAEPVSGAEVRLATPNAEEADAERREGRVRALAVTARTNERGFFQIVGAKPGEYELTVERTGAATARVAPVTIKEGLEAQLLETIVLQPPASLSLSLLPPTDPYGRPWVVALFPARRSASTESRGEATAEGAWNREDLEPGLQRLSISDQDGDRWLVSELTLRPGSNEELVELPLLEVRGTLEMGGEPLAARLFFTTPGGNLQKVRFAADIEGRFEGFLPRSGAWGVTVTEPGQGMEVTLEAIDVQPAQGKSWAEVSIALPGTRLEGRVVTASGQAVPAAQVRAVSFPRSRHPSSTTSAEDGRFRFFGLPEGNYVVSAEADDAESESVAAALDEELDPPALTLTLTLRETRSLAGVVHRAGRPVPGARVVALPDLSVSSSASLREAHTGVDGSFQLKLPGDALFLTVVVLAPGHATRIERTGFPPPGQRLELGVSPHGGDLTLLWPEPTSLRPGASLGLPILFHQGAAVPVPMLTSLLGLGGGAVSWAPIPLTQLEPGAYSFCLGREATQAWRQGLEPPAEGCASGFVAPGGQLRLAPAAPAGP